jgi:hypothetical protein
MDEIGCGDNSCIFRCIQTKGGQHTNGGCRCFRNLILNTMIEGSYGMVPYNNRDEVKRLERSVMLLRAELIELRKLNNK